MVWDIPKCHKEDHQALHFGFLGHSQYLDLPQLRSSHGFHTLFKNRASTWPRKTVDPESPGKNHSVPYYNGHYLGHFQTQPYD